MKYSHWLPGLGTLLAVLLSWPAAAASGERILAYHSEVHIGTGGGLDVTETITVRAEGRAIRRGIYRDFPTRYRDRYGNRVVVDFEVIEVLRDGRSEPWFTERLSNGVRVNTGDDRFLPVPGEFTFTLRYRTNRQLGFFAGHDELYWNATGTGWAFPIDRASAEIRLPEPVPAEQLQLDFYTGPQGAQGRNARAGVPAPGVVRFATTRPLGVREGLTVVAGFPKGIVAEPTALQRVRWLLYDNLGLLILLAGLVLVLAWYLWQWRRKGRDPEAGVIFARYQPPGGYSPAGLRYVSRMGYDNLCFAADVVEMAVKGLLRIHRDKRAFTDKWRLERAAGTMPGDLAPSQKALFHRLFAKGDELELDSSNASVVSAARSAHQHALARRYKPRYFITNAGVLTLGFVLSGAVIALAMLISRGHGLPWLIAGGVALGVVNFVFVYLMRAPTGTGRKLLDHIEGLRRYMSVAERDELRSLEHRGSDEPAMGPERYQALLPYALALGVEEAWTDKFTAAVGAAVADQTSRNLSWYQGSGVRFGSMGNLGSSLGQGLSSQIASSASPPGSGSGGGGGGSSGGGGGGGGGGGR